MAELLEMPNFTVLPSFEVMSEQLSIINSEAELLPQIQHLDGLQQAQLLEDWYTLHDNAGYATDLINSDEFWISDPNGFVRSVQEAIKSQYPNSSATSAATEWIVEGGKVTASGAAVAGQRIAYNYSASLAAGSSGTTMMGVLSMNLPTAAAAFAPLMGVTLGWALYEANPEFWTKISKALLPWCYPDTELMPVMADDKGNTYYPKDAVEAMRSVIVSQSVSDELFASVSSLRTDPNPFVFKIFSGAVEIEVPGYGGPEKYYLGTHASTVYVNVMWGEKETSLYRGSVRMILASEDSFIYSDQYGNRTVVQKPINFNGKTFYYGLYSWFISKGSSGNPVCYTYPLNKILSISENYTDDEVAYQMLFGASSDLGEGITKWNGIAYPLDIEPIQVLGPVSSDKTTYKKIPYIPISTPTGRPGESINEDVKDLTKNENPSNAINPWISSNPNPSDYPPNVSPSKNPAPIINLNPIETERSDPMNDPSQETPLTQPAPNSSLPQDSGTSPGPQNPDSPPIAVADSGLIHVYNPTVEEVRMFGKWLWTTFSGDIIDTVSKLFNNPMDAVIGLHELYTTPNIAGNDTIRAGYLDSKVPSKFVGNRYSSFSCGTVVVPEYYQNYLDYSPYTKCFIYLPFIGIVPVLADDIIGNAVNVNYSVDAYTGSCIATVNVAREGYSVVAYQFQGNCAVELPITSGFQSAIMAAVLGVAGAALTGNPHVGLAASNLGRASLGKSDVSHSGSFGASFGAMGAKVPYIIIKRPTQKSVVNYNEDYGFPAHKRVTISSCSGYLRAREVHVISATATEEEKSRIEEMLKEGVFVK